MVSKRYTALNKTPVIGIDGRPLQGNRRGDGRYVFELCRELNRKMTEAMFIIYSSIPIEMPVLSERWILRTGGSTSLKMPPLAWMKLRSTTLCIRDHVNLFWGTNTFLPYLPDSIKMVSTVHDLSHIIIPETYRFSDYLINRLFVIRDILRADEVMTVSEGTAQKVKKYTGRSSTIVNPAAGDIFHKIKERQIQECKKRYRIDFPYFMAIGVREPRKNLECLIRTFLEMKKEGLLSRYKLLLLGEKGWKYHGQERLISGEGKGIVESIGYVPDEDLPSLYCGSELFIFPSLYEGFGIPVLEARACGIKAVISDTIELREAGGDEAFYIPPTENGIRNGILQALASNRKGKIPAKMPSWEKGAQIITELFRRMLDTSRGKYISQ